MQYLEPVELPLWAVLRGALALALPLALVPLSTPDYVQELPLEEAAKLADAAVRESLGKAGASSLAASVADALQAPNPNPNPNPNLVPSLSRTERTDEQSLAAFGELWDPLAPPLALILTLP